MPPVAEAARETGGNPGDPGAASEFLRRYLASEARRLDPAELDLANCPVLDFAEGSRLAVVVSQYDRTVEQDRRYPADPRRQQARLMHLRVKGDLARALLYVLVPGSKILNTLAPRPEAMVPALWFAPLLAPNQWDRLERYSADELGTLVAHSTDPRRLRQPLSDWLGSWAGTLDEERRVVVMRSLGARGE